MKVEIWSDIMCPFCYIGKRRLEAALAEFPHRDAVDIVWRSYQLSPQLQPTPGQTIDEMLAQHKGIPLAQAHQLNAQMTQTARQAGLTYDFDKAIPANTFLAHQLVHFGAQHGRQDAVKERLFAAYYTEGRDVGDLDTLVQLATETGLPAAGARQALASGTYANAVRYDAYQAQQINVRGVPFFVFADKYAVSGAQPSEVFAEVLATVWQEAQPPLQPVGADGPACGPEGCD